MKSSAMTPLMLLNIVLLSATVAACVGERTAPKAMQVVLIVLVVLSVLGFLGRYVYVLAKKPELLRAEVPTIQPSLALPIACLLGGTSLGIALAGVLGGIVGGALGLWIGLAAQRPDSTDRRSIPR